MEKGIKLMKNIVVFVTGVVLYSCMASDDGAVNSGNKADSAGAYNRYVNIYDTLSIDGNFVSDIAQYKLVLENELGQTFEFELTEASTHAVKVFIPKDFKPMKYSVFLKRGNSVTTLGDSFSEPVEVYVRKRPVVLKASATSFKKGASIVLTGENFSNTSGIKDYDPRIYMMSLGYSNNNSDVTVNTAGTTATVTINMNLNPGKYELFLTTDNGNSDSYEPWSNPVNVEVIP